MSSTKSETGAQLLARLGQRPPIKDLEPNIFPAGASTRQVVEISGEEGTGKTEILLHLLSQIILPKRCHDIEFGGLEAKAIFIDLDYKFSILRLALILEKKIIGKAEQCRISLGSEEVEGIIKRCLARCLVIKCSSSQQLIVTLESLQKTVSEDPSIVAILIDTISAFYWLDKYSHGDSASLLATNAKIMTDTLSKLVIGYSLILIVTKALLFKKKGKTKPDQQEFNPFSDSDDISRHSHIEFMPKSWEKFVQQRFLLEVSTRVNETRKYSMKSCSKDPLLLHFEINESGVKFP